MRSRIFAVGFELPGDEFEYIDFGSDQTLLDADIVLFEPTLGDYSSYSGEFHNGKRILTQSASASVKVRLAHWHSEIVATVSAAGELSREAAE